MFHHFYWIGRKLVTSNDFLRNKIDKVRILVGRKNSRNIRHTTDITLL